MRSLVTHQFLFTAKVSTPLELDDHCGAALRGNFFEAVWRRFCTNKTSPTCAQCPLHSICPVSALVAPLREENPRGRDIPRPYIILPPLGRARRYAPGDRLLFGMTLFGNIVQLLPYIILSLEVVEEAGLGRKLPENGGRRGQFKVQQIESYKPNSPERQVLYTAGKPLVEKPALTVTSTDVAVRAATLPTDKITLNFLTPTRIKDQKRLVRYPEFRPLIHRLLERLDALENEYGTADEQCMHERQHFVELAEGIQCVEDETSWEEVQSYSYRTKQLSPISGLVGRATFAGNLEPFRELLSWGELVHVGKSCVKGNGWYKIECGADEALLMSR